MKKTVTVNLNGRVFTMDEDAYRLLDNYLNNLRIYFRKEEGASEINADFEARIEELFSEKIRLGYQVITIEQVEEVIARVGKPADFADGDEVEEEKQPHFTEYREVKKKFYRDPTDKGLGGVCSGIAAYFGWDVLLVRIVFIILLFATSGWIVPFYIVAWIFFAEAHTAEQRLQMCGKPITVENIGKTVTSGVEPAFPKKQKGCLSGFIDVIVALLKVFLVGMGCFMLFGLVVSIIITILIILGLSGGLLGAFPAFFAFHPFVFSNHPLLSSAALLFVLGIPVIALIYAIIAHFAKLKSLNRSVKFVFFIIWIFAFITFLFSGFKIETTKWNWNWADDDGSAIRGNGIFRQITHNLNEPVKNVEVGKFLCANLLIEQTWDNSPSIEIKGDENLVEQVKYVLQDGRLILSSNNKLYCDNNLKISLKTNDLKSISTGFIGNVQMNSAFYGEELKIGMSGAGNFSADSLFINSLTVNSGGIASIRLSGKANKAQFDLSGAGKIDAFELVSDTVFARVNGVGSIQCNPLEYLDGRLLGIGKITYKQEPKSKKFVSAGIGRMKWR